MAKVRHKYECANCGCTIAYKDDGAYFYNGDLFCDADCAMNAAGIENYDWSGDYGFDYTRDESNGYGVCLISDGWYSNKYYAICDKCPFKFDKDYERYFGLNADGGAMLREFVKKASIGFDKANFIKVKRPMFRMFKKRGFQSSWCTNRYIEIFGRWFDADLYDFVIKQLNNGILIPNELQIALYELDSDEVLFIICNGKHAVLLSPGIIGDFGNFVEVEKPHDAS